MHFNCRLLQEVRPSTLEQPSPVKMATGRFLVGVRRLSTSASRPGKLVQAPLQAYGVDGRYASALYSAASKEKKLDVVEKDLTKIQGILNKDKKFMEFISNPSVKRVQKRDVVSAALQKQNCDALTVNAFAAMAENGRLSMVNTILNTYSNMMKAHRGEVSASVTTAKPLDATQAKDVEATLKMFLGKGESLHLEMKTDPSLIGGMVVTIGDKYVDMSMAHKLNLYSSLIRQAV